MPWSIIFDRDSDQEVSLFVQHDFILMLDSVVARGGHDWDVSGRLDFMLCLTEDVDLDRWETFEFI